MASLEDQDAGGSRTPSPEFLCASPRLFENPLLDKLSRVHWSMPLVFYMPFVALLAWLSFTTLRPVTVGCMALLGYMIWTLIEYFGHRYLFHAEFPGTLGARIHLLIHGVHHDRAPEGLGRGHGGVDVVDLPVDRPVGRRALGEEGRGVHDPRQFAVAGDGTGSRAGCWPRTTSI